MGSGASTEQGQAAPAIIDGEAEEAAEFLDAGADIILRKPVSVAGVARALADAAALVRNDPAKAAA